MPVVFSGIKKKVYLLAAKEGVKDEHY